MILEVKIKPNAKKTEILKKENNIYTIAIKAPPEQGKANQELIKFLNKEFKTKAKIKTGHTNKRKLIEL